MPPASGTVRSWHEKEATMSNIAEGQPEGASRYDAYWARQMSGPEL